MSGTYFDGVSNHRLLHRWEVRDRAWDGIGRRAYFDEADHAVIHDDYDEARADYAARRAQGLPATFEQLMEPA